MFFQNTNIGDGCPGGGVVISLSPNMLITLDCN
jgi:hypothetical protein